MRTSQKVRISVRVCDCSVIAYSAKGTMSLARPEKMYIRWNTFSHTIASLTTVYRKDRSYDPMVSRAPQNFSRGCAAACPAFGLRVPKSTGAAK